MMFDEFERGFARDSRGMVADAAVEPVPDFVGLRELFRSFGGSSFAGGLYRIINPEALETWKLRVTHAFPQFEGRIVCFGYDWLGCAFALDSGRLEDNQPGVVMFEPGTGEALEIPCSVVEFHNRELKKYEEAALAVSFFQQWLGNGGQGPSIEQCVGYKKPLFLGGKDTVENLELADIEVYWHIAGQLIRKVRGLPKGTPVHVGKA